MALIETALGAPARPASTRNTVIPPPISCSPVVALDDIAAGLLVVLQRQQPFRLGGFQQFAEAVEAVIGLVESRFAALQRLLDHGPPDLVLLAPVLEQVLYRLHHQVQRLLAAFGLGFRR